ncbi:MAG TPA: hypothetical protein VJW94_15895 [Candidatus Acidoferrum sp.]|nr:hypothetical protein [Candidatus Acidoferrum sp.]
MAGTQRLLAITMSFSLASIPSSAKSDALGIVVQADHASLGSQAASEGTTVYDGDRLSTEAGGSLRLVIGEAMLYVPEQSSVIVHQDTKPVAKEFEAELLSGTAVISVTAATTGEIVASTARVRPMAETRGVVQVRLVGPHELLVFARRGPAQISYHGENETIAEGKSYRVLLNPSDDDASGDVSAKKSGKRGKALVVIAVAAVTAGTVILVLRGKEGSVESPDRP